MATRCANCGTTQGPFVRDPNFPSRPICGFPPRYRAGENERRARIAECNARRDQLDQSPGGKPSVAA